MIGRTLAHYEIEALLGAGGMGEVYRALDKRLGRSVAIKVGTRSAGLAFAFLLKIPAEPAPGN